MPQTLVPGSLHVREVLSLKTAILFHFINHYGFCKPRKMRTNVVKKCFQNIDAACRLVGEGQRSMGALKSRTNLGRLCSLAHKTRGVTEWLTMAAQVAEALCATCTELATEEEKTTCEKRLCQWKHTHRLTSPWHGFRI